MQKGQSSMESAESLGWQRTRQQHHTRETYIDNRHQIGHTTEVYQRLTASDAVKGEVPGLLAQVRTVASGHSGTARGESNMGERETQCVCVCVNESTRDCVTNERHKERKCVCVCVCVCVSDHSVSVVVVVHVYEEIGATNNKLEITLTILLCMYESMHKYICVSI